jgi:SAM-dependent methyltransferase
MGGDDMTHEMAGQPAVAAGFRKQHWEQVYGAKTPEQLTWYQATPKLSLEMVADAALPYSAAIIDVGGGASTLADHLLDQGYLDVSVLDIASSALAAAEARLGARAGDIHWIEGDILEVELPRRYDLWHDRAVLHFMVDELERERYVTAVRAALKVGGHLIVATFATTGPTRCSNLDVVRYAPAELSAVLGRGFHLVRSEAETHVTPWGSAQEFVFCHFHRHE